ncbi:hypothetical protein [Pedobacter sp. P26]|uniref:hypothetical protein n=1 Tax=Pedobacter sp. P26 TaxID=3423956 RepID=UPI003D67823C
MFKLPHGIPNSRTSSQDWTDYAEYLCLHDPNLSLNKLLKTPMLISDEIINSGIEDETDRFILKVDEIAAEVNLRIKSTGGLYPFRLKDNDYTLQQAEDSSVYSHVYVFLLLATRLNMRDEKKQNGLDGTQVFEKLCAEIALRFLEITLKPMY